MKSLDMTMVIQSQIPRTANIMLCQTCIFWTGTTYCKANYFIACVPAYIPECKGYSKKDTP